MTIPDAPPEGVPAEPDFDRTANRIAAIIAALAVLGAMVANAVRGWPWGGGFFVGALISGFNFHSLRRLVEGLGGEGRRSRGSIFFAFRYLLLGGAAYVIVRFTSVSLPAVCAGILVLTAAIMIEAGIEIWYARK